MGHQSRPWSLRAAAGFAGACCLAAVPAVAAAAEWPDGPLTTSGRWITDASGSVVQLAGVNWPAHTAAMIPEGLQYQSVASIVGRIKQAGFNVVRLTYATEMVDQIYAGSQQQPGPDVSLRSAVDAVFGSGDGAALLNDILSHNPSFSADTPRLSLFDAIAAECGRQQIYVHLDNHVSKAGWCCTPLDGNSWWGDTYFDAGNWTRGLSYMADHGKSWPNLVSMSLRNELRPPLNNLSLTGTSYNWATWYAQMQRGASAIHAANSNLLVYLSGLDGDTTLGPVIQSTPLSPSSTIFSRADFAPGFEDKLVLELHVYWNIAGSVGGGSGGSISSLATSCDPLNSYLDKAGFSSLTNTTATQYPVILTEFGFDQSSASSVASLLQTGGGGYAPCLFSYLRERQVPGWMLWPMAGSYYVREGERDADEPWGLLTHDWSAWRAAQFVSQVVEPAANYTLGLGGGQAPSPPASSPPSSAGGGSGDGGGGESWASGIKERLDMVKVLGVTAAAVFWAGSRFYLA
ncbi:glycoside hydrolase superfamily [Microdochium trichocladiopsis]|uniref:Glycoside hydrolase superfamily n=1 Tax=Microdochium trichocladiopsis TaxID=1682393 RepID=A0A9P8Y6T0_9PEZI|nr:glycoside hydrolase superfamily [Microdochium trichocladiopsis]KAH7029122.1 glycoside hydrolase superfamily [Microdochium trichocladiopsis]